MTRTLMRIHPTFASPARWLVLSTAVLLLATLVTGAMVAARSEAGGAKVQELAWPIAAALMWVAIAAQLLMPAARRRATTFSMSLPIAVRRLWLTSLLSSIAAAWLLAVVMIGGLEAGAWTARLLHRPVFPPGALVARALPAVLAAAALAAVLLHLPRPALERWSVRGSLGWYAFLAAALPGVLLVASGHWPAAFSLGCAAIAGAGLWWGVRRLPPALLMSIEDGASGSMSASRIPQWTWLTTIRWVSGMPALLWGLGLTFAFGVLQAAITFGHAEEDQTGLFMAPMLTYIMLLWLPCCARRLVRLSPLPISTRVLTAMLTVPPVIAAMAGYGAGSVIEAAGETHTLVEFQANAGRAFPLQDSNQPIVRIPSQYYEIAWDGIVPDLRAPSGEVHRPWQVPLWKGAKPVLYSPVSTSEPASAEFHAWQIRQALQLVYGIVTSPERILQMRDLEDIGQLVPMGARPRAPLEWAVPPLTLGICGLSFFLLAGLLFGLRRAAGPGWKRNGAAVVILAGLMAAYLIRLPLSLSGMTRGWILGGALSSIVRSFAEHIPGGALTLWLLCAAALYAGFEFAARRLSRAEVAAEPPSRFGF